MLVLLDDSNVMVIRHISSLHLAGVTGVNLVHRLLKIALRVLGPNRYELLMRYLAHIAVLRDQSVFLDDATEK